jgi:hypothetical protein
MYPVSIRTQKKIYICKVHNTAHNCPDSFTKGLRCYVRLLMSTVYWLPLKDFCDFFWPLNFFLVHTYFAYFFKKLILNTKKKSLKTTSLAILVPWLQYSLLSSDWSQVYSLLQNSGYPLNLLRVKRLCHLPLLLLLPDPGLPAGLPAGLEATEEGQDLGLDHIFIS